MNNLPSPFPSLMQWAPSLSRTAGEGDERRLRRRETGEGPR
jgi:hypothetical protein